ncbi:thiol-disulfide oxidoreductase ResA [Parageobacillus thermoglucosidasius]|uniref:Alkyl hydroperoxide reductase n=1 Tax=Parageobacillus thermoglucosidasius TaxID=1426 RepID=A0AAN0YN26_PARTM|nr:thiol-disulfide oxidoreductase ResA [Parageobacillus thermoglucosidasius]ALF09268.1 alkyl hydroperoxide reductase [Parageobacillus thermoglucosidasius]ANZ29350.1 alkyl hydroperoxide reductase [Parageobacillus thermoglucosidasius]APM80089.1 alkyl hydroperoxide reductase [Parageobacillus thermoglucosidasius]KJX67395.1 alkyl hydroperoxide reductase [Parageobacillus thermoglucosidasius]RDE20667.1 alkyl hydroperoxide reductase [Parageobacillus thermoglucosidasius]
MKRGHFMIHFVITSVLLAAIGYVLYSNLYETEEVIAAKVGNAAPDFTLKNLHGTEQTLSDFRGKGVFINFWATYCPPCEKEMPYLEKAYQQYKEKGIEILAINAAGPTRLVHQYIARKKVTFPILLDRDGLVVEQYQVQNLPTTFFINSKGEIVDKVSGELTKEKIEEGLKLIKP